MEMPWKLTQRRSRTPIAAILSSCAGALVRPLDPDADAVFAAFAAHVEGRKCLDDPLLEARRHRPHVGPPSVQVEHDIGHALAGAVIGELAAAPGGEHRETLGSSRSASAAEVPAV